MASTEIDISTNQDNFVSLSTPIALPTGVPWTFSGATIAVAIKGTQLSSMSVWEGTSSGTKATYTDLANATQTQGDVDVVVDADFLTLTSVTFTIPLEALSTILRTTTAYLGIKAFYPAGAGYDAGEAYLTAFDRRVRIIPRVPVQTG